MTMMLSLSLSLLLVVIDTTYSTVIDPSLDIIAAEQHCMTVFPSVSVDLLEEIKRTRKFPQDTSRDLKCFVHCVGKKLDKINDDGEYHFDGLKQLTLHLTEDVAHDEAHGMVSKCIVVDDPDECEKAFKYAGCKLSELSNSTLTKEFCKTC